MLSADRCRALAYEAVQHEAKMLHTCQCPPCRLLRAMREPADPPRCLEWRVRCESPPVPGGVYCETHQSHRDDDARWP